MRSILPLLAFLTILTTGGISYSHEVQEHLDIPYATVEGTTLYADVITPKGLDVALPAIIWIHGGGWKEGNRKWNMIPGLVHDGYVIVSIEYRLSGTAPWPAQLEDCQRAVRWVRENASNYGIDPSKIAVAGHSAGGHLAACLGTMGDGAGGQVQAVVDFAGPADFTTGKNTYGWALAPLFHDPELKSDAAFKAASPLFAVKPGLPPFFIAHGDKDDAVPLDESIRLAQALKEAGVPVELVVMKGGNHGMANDEGSPPPSPTNIEMNASMTAFLKRTLMAAQAP